MRPLLGMWLLVLGFQSVFGRGLRDIVQVHLPASKPAIGFPIAFVWLALEAGIVEEFFFRALLQSRLSRALRSELGASSSCLFSSDWRTLPACIFAPD